MTLGKGIGGGVPLAALLATEAASCFEHGDQGGTFNGNPLMCAAGLAVLKRVSEPNFLKSVVDAGAYLESELQRISARHGLGEVRGRGLLLALDLKLPIGASIVAQALQMACCSTRRSRTRCVSCRRSMSPGPKFPG